jgi:copper(I)-binding protein
MKDTAMTSKSLFAAATAAFLTLASAPLALAGDITVTDAYLRVSGAMAKTAAAFMTIENQGAEDRLIGVQSDLSKRVELHTHKQNSDGVMQMLHVEEGFAIPAGGHYTLARGGDHVMFLGLNSVPVQGDAITLVLTFEKAGEVMVAVTVDNTRAPVAGGMEHGTMEHGTMKQGEEGNN